MTSFQKLPHFYIFSYIFAQTTHMCMGAYKTLRDVLKIENYRKTKEKLSV